MYGITLAEIAEGIQGKVNTKFADLEPIGASIDTRTINKGDLFFAIEGEKVDGHSFLNVAKEKNAFGAVVSYIPKGFNKDEFPLIVVKDTKKALQQTASLMRKKYEGSVVAVTGSSGKTTTKDMIWSVLEKNMHTLRTQANYNNELGVPLTLLSLQKSHKAIVIEMGMRGLNEIDFLAQICVPTHGIITNIGHTHMELLGSYERIAQAKAELLSHIPYYGSVILKTRDKAVLGPWLSNIRSKIIWIGDDSNADIWAEDIKKWYEDDKYGVSFLICTKNGERIRTFLPVPGKHNVENALTAYAIGIESGLNSEEIKKGLEETCLSNMRLEIKKSLKKEITVINDTYNANPDSVVASLDVLQEMKKNNRAVAVLGDMYELGEYTKEGHELVGKKVTEINTDYLITVGELAVAIANGAIEAGMSECNVKKCKNNNEALDNLYSIMQSGDVILIKGSRGVRMEEITAELLKE